MCTTRNDAMAPLVVRHVNDLQVGAPLDEAEVQRVETTLTKIHTSQGIGEYKLRRRPRGGWAAVGSFWFNATGEGKDPAVGCDALYELQTLTALHTSPDGTKVTNALAHAIFEEGLRQIYSADSGDHDKTRKSYITTLLGVRSWSDAKDYVLANPDFFGKPPAFGKTWMPPRPSRVRDLSCCLSLR